MRGAGGLSSLLLDFYHREGPLLWKPAGWSTGPRCCSRRPPLQLPGLWFCPAAAEGEDRGRDGALRPGEYGSLLPGPDAVRGRGERR